tara:strand:+ start:2326 stop:3483 length:1158 start_codon:yes stop_codon:yes gene_type:complete
MTSSTHQDEPKKDIPLESMEVGHAGLYPLSADDSLEGQHEKITKVMGAITDVITADIPLGLKDGGKTLIACEQGIKSFVRDKLAGTKENPVDNHLPNTEVGVWIHYLTEGIVRDFGRTWMDTPKALRTRNSNKDETRSVRITKEKKNALIAQKDMGYWMPMISAGKITMEEAVKEVVRVTEEIMEYERQGIDMNPKKTAGITDFNCDKPVLDKWNGAWEALDVFKKYGIKITLPDIIENFFLTDKKPRQKYLTMTQKSALIEGANFIGQKFGLKGMDKTGAVYNEKMPQYGGLAKQDVNSEDDFWEMLPDLKKEIDSINGYSIRSIHLGSQKKIDNKSYAVIVDGLDTIKKERIIFVYRQAGGISRMKDDVWFNNQESETAEIEF